MQHPEPPHAPLVKGVQQLLGGVQLLQVRWRERTAAGVVQDHVHGRADGALVAGALRLQLVHAARVEPRDDCDLHHRRLVRPPGVV
jgi:hypothetical protein